MEPKRIEALADGVLAIAMTLLVIELKVPAVSHGDDAALTRLLLRDTAPHVLWYAASFVTIATFWIGHHTMFTYVRRVDRTFLWANVAFLLALAFLPFATALIGEHPTAPVSALVYGGTLMTAGTALWAMWWYATTGRRLTDGDLSEGVVRGLRTRIATGWVVYGTATLGGLLSAWISIPLFLLMPVAYMLPWGIDRHMRNPA